MKRLFLILAFAASCHAQGALFKQLLAATSSCSATPDTTNLVGWWKADAGVTGTSPVTSWADQSGHSNTLTPVGSPTLQTNQINGLPAIFFNSSNPDSFTLANPIAAGSVTIFIVIQLASGSTVYGAVGGTTGSLVYRFGSASNATYQGADSSFTASLGDGTAANTVSWTQANITFTQGGLVAFRLNRATDGSSNPGVSLSGTIQHIGFNQSMFPQQDLNGKIAEIFIYNAAIGSTANGCNETYLNGRYGL